MSPLDRPPIFALDPLPCDFTVATNPAINKMRRTLTIYDAKGERILVPLDRPAKIK